MTLRRSLMIAVALACILGLSSASSGAMNPCFSGLSEDLILHVPASGVDGFPGVFYDLMLSYNGLTPPSSGGAWFELSGAASSSLVSCSNPALFLFEEARIILRVPMAFIGQTFFWADFEYVPSTDGKVWFRIVSAGLTPNRVFATSVTGGGNLGAWPDAGGQTGLAAGDAICQARAATAGLPGTFKAWLSDGSNDAYCRILNLTGKKQSNCGQETLPVGGGPWVRTDGFPFGGSIDQIVDRNFIYAPLRADEFGNPVVPRNTKHYFLTGTRSVGSGLVSATGPCSNWTAAEGSAIVGVRDGTARYWTEAGEQNCNSSGFSLICLQVDGGSALPVFSIPGKKVFVTSVTGNGNLGSWADASGNSGLAAGDAICRARAGAAGFANAARFKAWLSDSAIDARDRLVSDGPWVRPDGVRVAMNKADLVDGSLFTSIGVTETMEYLAHKQAWTGTSANGTKGVATCDSWRSSAGGVFGRLGQTSAAYDYWTAGPTGDCSESAYYRLYCFED